MSITVSKMTDKIYINICFDFLTLICIICVFDGAEVSDAGQATIIDIVTENSGTTPTFIFVIIFIDMMTMLI